MNPSKKYIVYYHIRGSGGRSAVIDAPDITAARNLAAHMYGDVRNIVHDPSLEQRPFRPSFNDEGDERGVIHSIGREMAREHLGVIGNSLSDDAIAVLILLAFGLPVIGLWLGLPVYQAMILSPSVGVPPWTLCVGVGVVAFLLGWIVLYLCPNILLRVVGFFVYAGWVVRYIADWRYSVDLFRGVTRNILLSNTDVTNLQKAGLLIAGIAGASVMGNLGKAVKNVGGSGTA